LVAESCKCCCNRDGSHLSSGGTGLRGCACHL
jgi:hypothetical protein